MKCSLDLSSFFEKFSSLSILLFSSVSLNCAFKKTFFISLCYSLELCIQLGISFPFSFVFHVSPFLSY